MPLIQMTCTFCAKEFERQSWVNPTTKDKFCSQACAYSYRLGEKNNNWKGGPSLMPFRRRLYELQKRYGLSESEYIAKMDKLKGCCEICGESWVNPDSKQNLHVDHCHESGKTRGLLCPHCNRMLGASFDDTSILEHAINYLNKYKE